MRAFENGKMDLVQAESDCRFDWCDITGGARSAVRSLQGVFQPKLIPVLEKLIHLRLHVEAAIDFPEEEIDSLCRWQDFSFVGWGTGLGQEYSSLQTLQGQLLREGLQVERSRVNQMRVNRAC